MVRPAELAEAEARKRGMAALQMASHVDIELSNEQLKQSLRLAELAAMGGADEFSTSSNLSNLDQVILPSKEPSPKSVHQREKKKISMW